VISFISSGYSEGHVTSGTFGEQLYLTTCDIT